MSPPELRKFGSGVRGADPKDREEEIDAADGAGGASSRRTMRSRNMVAYTERSNPRSEWREKIIPSIKQKARPIKWPGLSSG